MDDIFSEVGVGAVEDYLETGTVRTQFDREKTPASMAVITTLAEMMAVDPIELEQLYFTIDPDALDAIVRDRNGTTGVIHTSFTHEDHAITVSSYGVVTITPRHGHADAYERDAGR